jgi:hypothetical protein
MIPYTSLPSVATFRTDSNGTIDARTGDSILQRIDEILAQHHNNHGRVMFQAAKMREVMILGRLYMAMDMWLKDVKLNANRDKPVWKQSCLHAVESLYKVGCFKLADRVGVPINQLPFWINESFGKSMGAHGVELDLDKGMAKYMDAPEADLCRIKFEAGRAYMRNTAAADIEFVPASSDAFMNDKIFAGGYAKHLKGHAGYVLSMGGDFFMGQHQVGGKPGASANTYHSSYTAGQAIRCAGTWKVEGGVVKEISDSSGHYQPTLHHMINAVETLKTYGVDIANLKVHYYGKDAQGQNVNVVGQAATVFLATQQGKPLAEIRNNNLLGQQVETVARKKLST